ncbi:hypothetical protein AVEN_27216-1 [Araneus ventricosus]|uniref:Uncharacterized protein n=1 Tax=Araneus ventricosus TaxID=182803 RepID=A0A4Y2DKV8_ARAVE|nr:hypothetical protein AVEN_27216-1 [Araneus ventricosus]
MPPPYPGIYPPPYAYPPGSGGYPQAGPNGVFGYPGAGAGAPPAPPGFNVPDGAASAPPAYDSVPHQYPPGASAQYNGMAQQAPPAGNEFIPLWSKISYSFMYSLLICNLLNTLDSFTFMCTMVVIKWYILENHPSWYDECKLLLHSRDFPSNLTCLIRYICEGNV